MLDGIRRPAKFEKEQLATTIVNVMHLVGQFRKSDERSMELRLNRVGFALKNNLPYITTLYKIIAEREPNFIYKQEIIKGVPELIVGMTIIVALDNIVQSIQPSIPYPIADSAFMQLADECRISIENF